uniref:Filamin B, beta (actin binding protein 278) n=1 Tax=Astyanax mexicanus TaxID=7994 RepID=A0A8B9RHE5_ASTMX
IVTAAQINLSDDAPWKKIQKNTFTRWCNEHLRCMDKQINDLRFDLSDGLNLICLLEVLSHKRMFRKYHARPTLRQLKLDNVSVALEFLDHEKIKLVSIDSKAIVDGNLKLILGLVWTLILHYSISIPVWEDDASDTVTKLTPEMRLLGWIQSKVPELPINNFSQDWQDGKALGALVDGLAPGLCPDWESWDTVQRVTNTREAMQQADDWLGVPQVIAPEEILDPGVDEQSVMTYLSLFPKARLKPGIFTMFVLISVPKPKACRATGRGLQARGLRVDQVADFKVDTHKAGPGNLAVHIIGPTGNEVAVKQREALEGISSFEYMPGDEGDYTVDITWANQHIPKSPFKVHVGPKAGPQKIRAWGPGLEGGTVGMAASFLVEATGAESGMLGFAIEGLSQAKIECDDQNDGSCFVRFWPSEAGEYAVHVMCDDEEIEDSPFMACVAPKKRGFRPAKVTVSSFSSKLCYLYYTIHALYFSPTKVLVNHKTEFTVDATQAGEGLLRICIQVAFDWMMLHVKELGDQDGIYNCSYTPTAICKHTIVVSWGGVSVPGSPFTVSIMLIYVSIIIIIMLIYICDVHVTEVLCVCVFVWLWCADEEMETDHDIKANVRDGSVSRLDINVVSPLDIPTDAAKVKAYGPGLQGVLLGQQAEFTIDTREAGSGRLTVIIEGPCRVTLHCVDNEDGTCVVFYLPIEHGEYLIRIYFDNSHIPGSPFHPVVQLPLDPSKVVVSGAGLTEGKVGEPCVVNIDCVMAGSGDLSVQAVSDKGVIAETKVLENEDGSYTVVYVPLTAGVYTLLLKYGGKVVPNVPAADVVDPAVYKSHVKFTGQGEAITSVTQSAGKIDVKLNVRDSIFFNCQLFYWVILTVLFTVACNVSGDPVNAEGNHDPSKVLADGLGLFQGLTGHPNKVYINTREAGNGSLGIMMEGPSESKVSCKENKDGSYTMEYTPSVAGSYDVNITYGGKSIPGSPFKSTVKDVSGTSAEISGEGLQEGICTQRSQTFTIDTSKAGKLPESVSVITPHGTTELLDIKDNGDGTYAVNFSPSMEGPHSLMVKYAGDDSYTSPFSFQVLSKSGISGPGLDRNFCPRTPQKFTIDESSTGEVPESVAIVRPDGSIELGEVSDNGDGTYSVVYSPTTDGPHSLLVKYTEEDQDSWCLTWCCSQAYVKVKSQVRVWHRFTDSYTKRGLLFQLMFPMSSSGEVIMPSGMTTLLDVTENGDGTMRLKFDPTEEGLHQILIKSSAAEFSLQYYANSSMNSCMKAHGPGLVYGVAHDPAAFTIYHEDTKIGDLDITIEGTSEAKVCCSDNKDGTCTVTYLPTQPGDYKIQVRHNDTHIAGSPFKARIADGSLRKSQVKLGTAVDFALDVTEEDISLLTASISSPTGQTVPCALKRQPDNHIGISFIPREVGEHLVSIKKDGEHLSSSPIPVCISQSEIGDATKVKVFGLGLHSGRTNHTSEFVVDTWEAGYGGLTVAIEGPANVVVHTEELENGACKISYCPTKPGTYKVSIRFSDEHIPGSPFLAEVTDGGLMKNSITHYQKPPTVASIGEECSIKVKIPGANPETMSAQVSAPSGTAEEAMVAATDRDAYIVSFVPEETGVHAVSVKNNGQETEGSPLQYTVGPLGEGGADKVQTWGQGLHRVQARIPADFNIWAREAGEGSMCVSVEGPGHTELYLDDHEDGSFTVSYIAQQAGDYEVSVMFDEQHISSSPFVVSVSAHSHSAQNSPEGWAKYDSKGMNNNFLPHDVWRASVIIFFFMLKMLPYIEQDFLSAGYKPMNNGCTESSDLNSTCNSGAESGVLSDAPEITSHGPGLSEATVGQKNTFYVDCSKAGKNMLFVGMLGPTVPCERVTVRHLGKNQYTVNYTVKERGKYILAVKWGEEHIPGSPFHIDVL